MFKLVAVFAVVIAAASAGIIGHAGPAYAVAPVAHSHASSYANSNLLAIHPVPVAIAAHAAPVAVAHAVPVASVGIAHGGLIGGGLIGHGGLGGLGGLGGHGGLYH